MGHGGHLLCEEDEQCARYIKARLNGDVTDKITLVNHLRRLSASPDTLAEREEPMSSEGIDWCLRIDALSFAVRVCNQDGQLTASKEYTRRFNSAFFLQRCRFHPVVCVGGCSGR